MDLSISRAAAVLAAARIFTGLGWFSHGFGKLANPHWAAPSGAFEGIAKDMASGTSGPYHDFMTAIVVPHATTFATLVAWGETLTGISLALGLFSRVGGAGGVFLALNYWLAKAGFTDWTTIGGLDWAYIVLSAIHIKLPTGSTWGLDGVIAARMRPAGMVEKS